MKSLKSANVKLPSNISPMAKWIVTIVILGIGVVLVVYFYAREESRNSDLKDRVNTASRILAQNSLKKQDLEERLTAANLGMAELAAQFPPADQSMDLEEALYDAAADSDVAIVNVNCSEPKAQEVGDSSYVAYVVNVSLTGETQNLLTFVGRLGFWLPSATIDSVSVGEGDMNLALKIYTAES